MFKVKIKNKLTSESVEKQLNTGREAQDFLYSIVGAPNSLGLHDDNYQFEISEILSVEQLNEEVRQKRRIEYPQVEQVVESLVELIFENRPQKSNEIQAARIAVKNKYPKIT